MILQGDRKVFGVDTRAWPGEDARWGSHKILVRWLSLVSRRVG